MAQQCNESIKPYSNVLVYGSGLSGLSTALRLAHEEMRVAIVQTSETEGHAELAPGYCYDFLCDSDFLKQRYDEALKNENIVFIPVKALKHVVAAEKGFLLTTTAENDRTLEYGTIVFAPERREHASEVPDTLNLTQLYSIFMARENIRGTVVFLLDDRADIRVEVFRDVLHAALHLRETANAKVWILSKDIQVALQGQQKLYDDCRESGILFVKYRDAMNITGNGGAFELTGFDPQIGAEFVISRPNALVIPHKTGLPFAALSFAQSLNIRILNDTYTQPDSLWCLPNETNRPGIFAVGTSRGNMDRQAIMRDAASVALSVRERLKPEGIAIEEHIPIVDEDKCAFCLTCIRTCPFGVMEQGIGQVGAVASVNLLACRACGTCVAVCPAGALQLRNEILDF